MKRLVIAEKAKMARALRDGLGGHFDAHIEDKGLTGYYESSDVIITFARGHLLRLFDVDDYFGEKQPWNMNILPFVPEKFKYKPTPGDDTITKQLSVIKSLINRADVSEIVHLGDPDREGELLVRLILKYNGNKKPVKRMWCLAIVPEVAKDAYNHLEDISKYDSWFAEGLVRQWLDWMWGINLTRFLTLKAGGTLPVGRVLIPIVKYIYDRDMKIKNFKSQVSWGVEGAITVDGKPITLRHKDLVFDFEQKDTAQQMAQKLSQEKAVVFSVESKETSKQPNKMFSLLKLQSTLSRAYGMTMEKSMEAIQKLYLSGHITYPRTPTEYISEKEISNTEALVSLLVKKGYPLAFHTKKTVFDESKCHGHTAITPTQQIPSMNDLTPDEQKVYQMVFNRFISNFYQQKVKILETTATIQVGEFEYTLVGEQVLEKGFLNCEKRSLKPELPKMSAGETFPVEYQVVEKESQPPKKVSVEELNSYLKAPYKDQIKNMSTDDELYKMLADGCSIGTEATTTVIIGNAIKYGYISMNGKSYSIEPTGIYLIETLDNLGINLYKDKNVEFNKELKAVYRTEKRVQDVVNENKQQLIQIIEGCKTMSVTPLANRKSEKTPLGICPRCGKNIYECKTGFYCKGFSDESCRFFISKKNNLLNAQKRKVTATMIKGILKNGKYPVKGLVSAKTNKKYDTEFTLEDTGTYVNLKMVFPNANHS